MYKLRTLGSRTRGSVSQETIAVVTFVALAGSAGFAAFGTSMDRSIQGHSRGVRPFLGGANVSAQAAGGFDALNALLHSTEYALSHGERAVQAGEDATRSTRRVAPRSLSGATDAELRSLAVGETELRHMVDATGRISETPEAFPIGTAPARSLSTAKYAAVRRMTDEMVAALNTRTGEFEVLGEYPTRDAADFLAALEAVDWPTQNPENPVFARVKSQADIPPAIRDRIGKLDGISIGSTRKADVAEPAHTGGRLLDASQRVGAWWNSTMTVADNRISNGWKAFTRRAGAGFDTMRTAFSDRAKRVVRGMANDIGIDTTPTFVENPNLPLPHIKHPKNP